MHAIRSIRIASTRAGIRRTLHATRIVAATHTKGQAPDASRKPKERTHLDQNEHLKHAASSEGGEKGRDRGKGNAAPNPELPSKSTSKGANRSAKSNGKRGLHTTVVLRADSSSSKHSADDYFKDVDSNPPQSDSTHSVDGASGAVQRPHQQYADPKRDYATVSKDEPYEPPAEGSKEDPGKENSEKKETKLRYGGTKRDAERGASKGDEGPESSSGSAQGRKPEGRQ